MNKSLSKSSHKLSKNKSEKRRNFKKMLCKRIKSVLVRHLNWKNNTAFFIAYVACNLLSLGKIGQKHLIQKTQTRNKKESDIRKLQRIFNDHYFNYAMFSQMLLHLLNLTEKTTILIDRTNWDYGQKHINILVAAALFQDSQLSQKSAIPLAWEVFDKKGNSNITERKTLMQKLINVVGKGNIKEILGDREFIGDEWIKFLQENLIPFVLRFKKNMYVEKDGKRVQAEVLVSHVKYKEKVIHNVILNGIPVQLVATRSIDKELVIAIASMDIKDPLDEYRLRWLIELFFKSIKSKGFNFEETHMTDPERIKKLFAITALATLIAVQAGVLKHCFVKKIRIPNHGRPLYSLFTYGLDFIRDLFEGVCDFDFNKTLHDFLVPPNSQMQLFASKEKSNYALLKG